MEKGNREITMLDCVSASDNIFHDPHQGLIARYTRASFAVKLEGEESQDVPLAVVTPLALQINFDE